MLCRACCCRAGVYHCCSCPSVQRQSCAGWCCQHSVHVAVLPEPCPPPCVPTHTMHAHSLTYTMPTQAAHLTSSQVGHNLNATPFNKHTTLLVVPLHVRHESILPTGIVAADLTLMTTKPRQQLLEALMRHTTPTAPKDLPPGVALPPVAATCWAAASWQDVCPEGRQAGRRGSAAGSTAASFNGFDLSIADNTVYEGEGYGCSRCGLDGCKTNIWVVMLTVCPRVCMHKTFQLFCSQDPGIFATLKWFWPCKTKAVPSRCKSSHLQYTSTPLALTPACPCSHATHTDDLWALLDGSASSERQHQQQVATSAVRHLIAGAACCNTPVLTEAAQAFLGKHVL